MGLTFDLANPLAVVSEVVAGGSSQTAGVKIGDHLVRSSTAPPAPIVFSPPLSLISPSRGLTHTCKAVQVA